MPSGAPEEESDQKDKVTGAASTTSNASTTASLVTVGAARASMGVSETYQ